MFRQKFLTAKREAGLSPARSRRCKRGVLFIARVGFGYVRHWAKLGKVWTE